MVTEKLREWLRETRSLDALLTAANIPDRGSGQGLSGVGCEGLAQRTALSVTRHLTTVNSTCKLGGYHHTTLCGPSRGGQQLRWIAANYFAQRDESVGFGPVAASHCCADTNEDSDKKEPETLVAVG